MPEFSIAVDAIFAIQVPEFAIVVAMLVVLSSRFVASSVYFEYPDILIGECEGVELLECI